MDFDLGQRNMSGANTNSLEFVHLLENMVRAGDIIMYRRERIEAVNVRIDKLKGGLMLAQRMSAFWIKQKERWAPLVNTPGRVVYQDEEGKGKI